MCKERKKMAVEFDMTRPRMPESLRGSGSITDLIGSDDVISI